MRVPVLFSRSPARGLERLRLTLGTSVVFAATLLGFGLSGIGVPSAAAMPANTGSSPSGVAGRSGIALDSATLGNLLQGPITLKVAGKTASLTLSSKVLRQAVVTDTVGVLTPTARLDQTKFNALLAPLATKVKVAPRDAKVALVSGKPALVGEAAGQELDIQNAVAATVAAATAPDRTATLAVLTTPATVNAAAVQPFFDQWSAILTNGFTYRYNGRTWRVTGTNFADAMKLAPGDVGGYQLTGMRTALDTRLGAVASAINVAPTSSRFRLVKGKVQQISVARNGIQVDRTASLAAAMSALTANQYQSDLIVNTQAASYDAAVTQTISTPDLLGRSSTSYVGSSPERAHNVEFGASLIDGALVPPGGEFSTANTMGPLTLAAGFQMGFGIVSDGKNVTTVPSEAGGICQVATTLFHTVFWAGLPITERHNHSYWIASYGVAPGGLQGLDATVSPPEKDFRWRNTTGNWVLIKARAGKGTITFELWGTQTGWKVQVDKPVISKVVATSTTPIYEKSDFVKWGVTRLVEHAQAGFNSDIHRQVFNAQGQRIDDWHAVSTYLPSHNRYLVGQKGKPVARPTAVPTAPPAATAVPAPPVVVPPVVATPQP